METRATAVHKSVPAVPAEQLTLSAMREELGVMSRELDRARAVVSRLIESGNDGENALLLEVVEKLLEKHAERASALGGDRCLATPVEIVDVPLAEAVPLHPAPLRIQEVKPEDLGVHDAYEELQRLETMLHSAVELLSDSDDGSRTPSESDMRAALHTTWSAWETARDAAGRCAETMRNWATQSSRTALPTQTAASEAGAKPARRRGAVAR